MIQTGSDQPNDALLSGFLKHAELQRQAVTRQNVPEANRQLEKLRPIANRLSATPEGRKGLEALLLDARPFVRQEAAKWAMAWNPERAIPVLGTLLVEEFGDQVTVDERLELRYSARLTLYLHFGIRDFDRNKLIEPLRAYGIVLPRINRAS